MALTRQLIWLRVSRKPTIVKEYAERALMAKLEMERHYWLIRKVPWQLVLLIDNACDDKPLATTCTKAMMAIAKALGIRLTQVAGAMKELSDSLRISSAQTIHSVVRYVN